MVTCRKILESDKFWVMPIFEFLTHKEESHLTQEKIYSLNDVGIIG